ncbi:MAG: hypothetical protein IIU18_06745 [Oscillospiraceae bacterium]|nr:hypothetical protein [Oscillospiraceae bacterium]
MKKVLALFLALAMIFALAACGKAAAPAATEAPAAEAPAAEEASGVMSYADYVAADLDSYVTIEAYVQAKQSWWDNKATIYLADADGAYLLYDANCSEEDYARLVPGQKLGVQGYKSEWSGEVEIVDASFEILAGDSYVAAPLDITAMLGTDELASHMNQAISVSDAVVADKGDGAAFFYNYDNSGEDGNSDLYFDIEVNGGVYTFVVRRYLTAPGSEVYEAVKNLKVGDKVDIEGFLYWYEGPQPHITAIVVK